MTVYVNLIRCPDCAALKYDRITGRCEATCCYCDEQSEPDYEGCVANGCPKDACRDWKNAEIAGEEQRERWEA